MLRTISSHSFFPFSARFSSSSMLRSKWSSIARLLRPVIIRISSIPLASASSTMYWIVGLSTIGSISFGVAFVAGKKRVPNPAAGITALVMVLKRMLMLVHRLFPVIIPASFLLTVFCYLWFPRSAGSPALYWTPAG